MTVVGAQNAVHVHAETFANATKAGLALIAYPRMAMTLLLGMFQIRSPTLALCHHLCFRKACW